MTTEKLRRMIAAEGGLHRSADLARRWRVSKARAAQQTQARDFPPPMARLGDAEDGVPVWTGSDADAYREAPRRVGRPPKT